MPDASSTSTRARSALSASSSMSRAAVHCCHEVIDRLAGPASLLRCGLPCTVVVARQADVWHSSRRFISATAASVGGESGASAVGGSAGSAVLGSKPAGGGASVGDGKSVGDGVSVAPEGRTLAGRGAREPAVVVEPPGSIDQAAARHPAATMAPTSARRHGRRAPVGSGMPCANTSPNRPAHHGARARDRGTAGMASACLHRTGRAGPAATMPARSAARASDCGLARRWDSP